MSRFYNKTLCIIGASGYLGQSLAREALQKGIKVIAISRSASFQESDPILSSHYKSGSYLPVHGDAHNPQSISQHLQKADAYIHTVGTLIDTSVTKLSQPGEKGTYEHMNRDALVSVAREIEKIGNDKTNAKRKIVYLSASLPPPFLKRYKTTKDQAAKYLIDSQQLEATILEPGFIWSWERRWWSLPLSYIVDIWAKLYTPFYHKFVPKNTFMHKFLDNFLVDRSVQLEDVTRAAVYSAFNQAQNGQYLRNEDIEKLSIYYNLDIALNEEEAGQNLSGKQQMQNDQQQQQQQEEKLQQEKVDQKMESQMQEQEESSSNWVHRSGAQPDLTQNEIEKKQKLNKIQLDNQMQEMEEESANYIKQQQNKADVSHNEIERDQKLKEQKLDSQRQEMEDESANWIHEQDKKSSYEQIDEIAKQQKQKQTKLDEQMQEMEDESANWNKNQK